MAPTSILQNGSFILGVIAGDFTLITYGINTTAAAPLRDIMVAVPTALGAVSYIFGCGPSVGRRNLEIAEGTIMNSKARIATAALISALVACAGVELGR